MAQNEIDKPLLNISNHQLSLRNISLLIILVGVLVPSVIYSVNLRNPTPTELLIAIGITLFASVVYLWILDATNTLRFRAEWISKSVYGAAIVSVLGTSVGVYSDFFSERKYPYEGKWELSLQKSGEQALSGDFDVSMSYSESFDGYWGYSNLSVAKNNSSNEVIWAEIVNFNEKKPDILINVFKGDSKVVIESNLTSIKNGKRFESKSDAEFKVRLYRTK